MLRFRFRSGCIALLLWAGFGAASLTAPARAATTTTLPRLPMHPKPAPDGQRFLFVVDISSGTRSLDAANRQALFDLIFTGLEGQMRTGDSFGLWLFNDELHAGQFPMQVWVETNTLASASLAATERAAIRRGCVCPMTPERPRPISIRIFSVACQQLEL